MDVTITRGGESIAIPLLGEGADVLVSSDLGKPHLNIYDNGGSLDPRFQDNWSGNEQYNVIGRFIGDTAYADAIALADLLKSHSGGTATTLDIPMDEYPDNIEVSPAAGQDATVSFAYAPGRRNNVDVDLGLTRVSETLGAGTMDADTPTATGSGPIQLSNGTDTVDLVSDVVVERSVGRPNSKVSKRPADYPAYVDQLKAAYDGFELSFVETGDSVTTDIQALRRIFSPRLRNSAITLSFNGLYGLGSFSVVPSGSQGLRHTRDAGKQGVTFVPTVSLRVVTEVG